MVSIKFVVMGALIASVGADYSGGGSSYSLPSSGGDTGYSSGYDAGYSSSGASDYGGYSGGYSGGSGGGYGDSYGHGHQEEHHEAKPYEFGYTVKDHHHGTDFGQQESSDGHNVKGSYRVVLPDGRTQIVTYHADWKTGFHADVRYEGEAHYPAPSHGGDSGYSYPAPQSGYSTGGGSDYSGHSTGGYRR